MQWYGHKAEFEFTHFCWRAFIHDFVLTLLLCIASKTYNFFQFVLFNLPHCCMDEEKNVPIPIFSISTPN